MRKLILFCFFCTLLFSQTVPSLAAHVEELRWVTRNDARVPFVRVVMDVDRLPSIDAELSKNGRNLKVTLAKTNGKKVIGTYALNPKMVSKLNVNQENKDTVLSFQFPQALSKNSVKVFPLKRDKTHNKPYRVVIDLPQYVPEPTFKTTAGLKGKTIVIDPGHGGTDVGAIGEGNVYEKNITLPIAIYLKPLLEEKGAKVYMTRETDRDVARPHANADEELQARVDVAEVHAADAFISIHIDSFVRPDIDGMTAYYCSGSLYGQLLAESLHEANLAEVDFGDRGVRTANFYVLCNSSMPSTLLELGFISNPRERAELQKPNVQKALAQSIVDGLETYFKRAEEYST
ncbi:MAG: N-acetylmuramoyl-L-alanine amidase [Negativicoccus succinicivorans]|nr:N-acetylmuramoyl-L-alanine amidase [Negativicoccus succinicivorans]